MVWATWYIDVIWYHVVVRIRGEESSSVKCYRPTRITLDYCKFMMSSRLLIRQSHHDIQSIWLWVSTLYPSCSHSICDQTCPAILDGWLMTRWLATDPTYIHAYKHIHIWGHPHSCRYARQQTHSGNHWPTEFAGRIQHSQLAPTAAGQTRKKL